MWKFTKMLLGLALLPACWAVSSAVWAFYRASMEATGLGGTLSVWALPAGFVLWTAIFFLLPRPTRTYVLGHELTHAVWALMMGGRVGRMKVGSKGGHVEVSKSNFAITLAPYFFPFYTFLVIAAYYIAGMWWEVGKYQAWWLGAVGFTWAFHVTFTLSMLAQRQPDIQEHGRIFSYVVIYLMNTLCIGLWMATVGSPRFATFADLLAAEASTAYQWTWSYCIEGWNLAAKLVNDLR